MSIGDRVVVNDGRSGEIVAIVSGTLRIRWYYVQFADGTEDRFTERDIGYSSSMFRLV